MTSVLPVLSGALLASGNFVTESNFADNQHSETSLKYIYTSKCTGLKDGQFHPGFFGYFLFYYYYHHCKEIYFVLMVDQTKSVYFSILDLYIQNIYI